MHRNVAHLIIWRMSVTQARRAATPKAASEGPFYTPLITEEPVADAAGEARGRPGRAQAKAGLPAKLIQSFSLYKNVADLLAPPRGGV
jgi:hypothetical protein